MFSPLEQFTIIPFFSMKFFNSFELNITNLSMMVILWIIILHLYMENMMYFYMKLNKYNILLVSVNTTFMGMVIDYLWSFWKLFFNSI